MAALNTDARPTAEPDGASAAGGVRTIDLRASSVRHVNAELHDPQTQAYEVLHPQGAHALAAGVRHPISVDIRGHAGYYAAGMNDGGTITVHGSAGTGVAENMMCGTVRVHGDASQSAGATGHGGLLVIDGSASMRCGISMKGINIVVGGDVGPMSAFMAQAGRLVVCGDAGDALGDSIYEARLYVRGAVGSLGADCVEKPVRAEHLAELADLLKAAGLDHDPASFRRYGSARTLYHFASSNTY
ncbi:glutamate synthase [Cryptosporangium aurantiacum]|uniref:N-methylglutamate synthase subunit B n=1 Tax=Cryptosporangium aurantiacum TaxID=134849 RepID=A0A1M7TVA5_9ACTN|nr:glutamate synthase [Cryptosporangium aurantiacum]SHN74543.1 N-methylglutamate synthase subunit B [Cryptosporangium aurantiacum]